MSASLTSLPVDVLVEITSHFDVLSTYVALSNVNRAFHRFFQHTFTEQSWRLALRRLDLGRAISDARSGTTWRTQALRFVSHSAHCALCSKILYNHAHRDYLVRGPALLPFVDEKHQQHQTVRASGVIACLGESQHPLELLSRDATITPNALVDLYDGPEPAEELIRLSFQGLLLMEGDTQLRLPCRFWGLNMKRVLCDRIRGQVVYRLTSHPVVASLFAITNALKEIQLVDEYPPTFPPDPARVMHVLQARVENPDGVTILDLLQADTEARTLMKQSTEEVDKVDGVLKVLPFVGIHWEEQTATALFKYASVGYSY